MVEFFLLGHVYPMEKEFTFTEPPPGVGLVKFGLEISPRIERGLVEVHCKAQAFDANTLFTALLVARSQLGAVISLYTFATGDPYTLHFDGYRLSDDPVTAKRLFTNLNPDLAPLVTAFDAPGASQKAMALVITNPRVADIVNDIAMAVTGNNYQPIACGRAMDGIRNYLFPESDDGKKTKQGFEKVATLLNISTDYGTIITETARKPRHRGENDFADEIIPIVVRRAWEITNRFLAYELGGKIPLKEPEFPHLKAPP